MNRNMFALLIFTIGLFIIEIKVQEAPLYKKGIVGVSSMPIVCLSKYTLVDIFLYSFKKIYFLLATKKQRQVICTS